MKTLNLTNEDYHAHPAIGSSQAKLMLRSRRLFKDELDGLVKHKESRAFQFGTAAHAKFLQPELFGTMVATGPVNEKTGKPYGTETKSFAEWYAQNPGKIILGEQDIADLDMMAQRMPDEVRYVLECPGEAEVSFIHQAGLIQVKARPDWLTGDTIYDLKTIGNMDDSEKHINKYLYWFSHAWYRSVVKLSTGNGFRFRFVFAEKSPPYRWRIIDLDLDWVIWADQQVASVIRQIQACTASGDWSDDGQVCQMVSRPAWETDEDDEDGE